MGFETHFTFEEIVASFRRHINISGTSDEGGIILEACFEEEQDNLTLIGSSIHFFLFAFSRRPRFWGFSSLYPI